MKLILRPSVPASDGKRVYGLGPVGEVLDEVEHVHVVGVQQAHVVDPTRLNGAIYKAAVCYSRYVCASRF